MNAPREERVQPVVRYLLVAILAACSGRATSKRMDAGPSPAADASVTARAAAPSRRPPLAAPFVDGRTWDYQFRGMARFPRAYRATVRRRSELRFELDWTEAGRAPSGTAYPRTFEWTADSFLVDGARFPDPPRPGAMGDPRPRVFFWGPPACQIICYEFSVPQTHPDSAPFDRSVCLHPVIGLAMVSGDWQERGTMVHDQLDRVCPPSDRR
jgi:hypothetical protein